MKHRGRQRGNSGHCRLCGAYGHYWNTCGRTAGKPEHWLIRFWSRVDSSSGVGACWPWLGKVSEAGYGFLGYLGEKRTAPSVAWELHYGKPVGTVPSTHGKRRRLSACHHCDNPRCCNPRHIYIGTQQDNCRDGAMRGRWPTSELRPIIAAADLRSRGSAASLARELGISRQRVHQIRAGYRSPSSRLKSPRLLQEAKENLDFCRYVRIVQGVSSSRSTHSEV